MDRRAIPARRVQGRKDSGRCHFRLIGLAPLVADAADDHPHRIHSQAGSNACGENRTRLPVDHRVHPAQIRHRVDDTTTDLLGHQRPRVGDGVVVAASVDATLPFPGVVNALDAVGDHRWIAGDGLERDHVPGGQILVGGRLDHDERAGGHGRFHRAGENRVRSGAGKSRDNDHHRENADHQHQQHPRDDGASPPPEVGLLACVLFGIMLLLRLFHVCAVPGSILGTIARAPDSRGDGHDWLTELASKVNVALDCWLAAAPWPSVARRHSTCICPAGTNCSEKAAPSMAPL